MNSTRRHNAPHPAGVPVVRPEPGPDHRSFFGRLLRAIFSLLALLLFALVGLALGVLIFFGWFWRAEGKILPGVTALGLPMSGYTAAEMAAVLDDRWQSQTLTVMIPGQSIQVSAPEVGLVLHTSVMAARAAALTRSTDVVATANFLWNDGQIDPLVSLDPQRAEQFLQTQRQAVTIEPIDAGFTWQDGRFIETPSIQGETVDIPATLASWQSLTAVYRDHLELPVVMMPLEPELITVQPLVEALNRQLDRPLAVIVFDPIRGEKRPLQLDPAMWGTWLIPQKTAQQTVEWQLDDRAIKTHLGQIGQLAGLSDTQYLDPQAAVALLREIVMNHLAGQQVGGRSLRVYHTERLHAVQPGETIASIARHYGFPYPWLQAANPGVDTLAVGQTLVIPSPDQLLPLPVVENKRIEISLSQQRLWAYENDALLWEWPISTGIADSPTSPGIFQVQTHEEVAYASIWDLFMPHFLGIYQPVPGNGFMNGFHGFPTRGGSQLLWTNSLGTPVTYGCILVDNAVVKDLYSWAEEGVVVEIRE